MIVMRVKVIEIDKFGFNGREHMPLDGHVGMHGVVTDLRTVTGNAPFEEDWTELDTVMDNGDRVTLIDHEVEVLHTATGVTNLPIIDHKEWRTQLDAGMHLTVSAVDLTVSLWDTPQSADTGSGAAKHGVIGLTLRLTHAQRVAIDDAMFHALVSMNRGGRRAS